MTKDDSKISTIQLKKPTKAFLRMLVVATNEGCYDDVLSKYMIPLLEKSAGTKDPVKIGKWIIEQGPSKKS